MKTYLFNNQHYGGGKSSGFPGLGRMVYDIIKDWADKNRPASLGELTAKFPQTLTGSSAHSKSALFASKQDAESRSQPRHVHQNRRFLVIRTGDDSEYAVSKEWGDLGGNAGDIVAFVEHACGMGYDIEEIADEKRHISERGIGGLQATRETSARRGHKKFAKGRYRVTAVGDVQNAFVRHILGNLGEETFSERDWKQTKTHFGGKCAYCGKEATQRDHIVPMNRKAMGEHRLGNLVPSCRSCNTAKGDKDYREWDFLADNPVALQRIKEYMREHGYSPIKDRKDAEKVREILEAAYRDIEPLAKEYIRKLNELLG